MAKKNYAPGTTSRIEPVKCINLSTGADMQVLFSDLTAYYCVEGSAPVAVTLVTAAQGTYTNSGGAGTGGGFIATSAAHMPGEHEFSWPNAALASPGKSVRLCVFGNSGTSVGMKTIDLEVQMDTYVASGANIGLSSSQTFTNTLSVNQTGDSYAVLHNLPQVPVGTVNDGSPTMTSFHISLPSAVAGTDITKCFMVFTVSSVVTLNIGYEITAYNPGSFLTTVAGLPAPPSNGDTFVLVGRVGT